MNRSDDHKTETHCHPRADRAAERPARSRRAGRAARRKVTSPLRGGGPLTKDAERLLFALAVPGAAAVRDPTDEAFVIVRRGGAGVTLAAGRFPLAAAARLARHDLAHWESEERVLKATAAGLSHATRRTSSSDTPFLDQHLVTGTATVETPSGPAQVRVDLDESPLDWLRRRRGRDGNPLIDDASFKAGERLRADITLAGLLPGVTARFDMARTGGPPAPGAATERMVAARQRLRHALEAVGADFSDLLMDLCGFLKGLELIERERGWPPRSAKVVVRLALARLAEHYGLEMAARGPAAGRGIRAWRAIVIEGGRG
jgi:hypothetical protein